MPTKNKPVQKETPTETPDVDFFSDNYEASGRVIGTKTDKGGRPVVDEGGRLVMETEK